MGAKPMSVARGGGGWNDLEHQFARTLYTIDAADSPADVQVEGAESFEPAGGLARDEVAELVEYEFSYFLSPRAGASAPFVDHAIWEVSLDPEAFTLQLDAATAVDGTVMVADTNESVDPDVLHIAAPHQNGMWSDSATGVGGGGTMHMNHGHINYRDRYGTGPELDRHDTIYNHLRLESEAGATTVNFYVQQGFHWAIREEA